jgi:hypothetical protein
MFGHVQQSTDGQFCSVALLAAATCAWRAFLTARCFAWIWASWQLRSFPNCAVTDLGQHFRRSRAPSSPYCARTPYTYSITPAAQAAGPSVLAQGKDFYMSWPTVLAGLGAVAMGGAY